MDYERDRSNKQLKKTYKQANRDYKKALNSNTTYRKAAATAAAIGVGTKVVNDVMMSNNVTFNGQRVKFSAQNVNSAINAINKGKEFMGFFY